MPRRKRGSTKALAAALVRGGDPSYRGPLVALLESACRELERRIARGDTPDGVDTIELIGVVRTASSVLVEADALLGEASAAEADVVAIAPPPALPKP